MSEIDIAKLLILTSAAGLIGGLIAQGLIFGASKLAGYFRRKANENRIDKRIDETYSWFPPPEKMGIDAKQLAREIRKVILETK